MTKYTKTIGALAATTMLMGGYATAELEGEISVGYTNMYEFRFVDTGQDLVSAGADVAWDFGNGWAITGGAWYGSTSDSKPFGGGIGSIDELDIYAGVSKEFGAVDVEVGYIFYHFLDKVGVPGGFASAYDTQEIYASVGTEFGGGWGASATGFWDIQRYNGFYAVGEVTYSVELSACLSLDLAGGVAYADGAGSANNTRPAGQLSRKSLIGGNWGGTVDGYQGWYISAALPWAATENLTVTPFIKYTDADSDLLTDANRFTLDSGKNYFIAGCSLSVAF